MFELILMTAMVAQPKMETAQFQPCVWPNKCAKQVEQVAQFKPCVWPNKCSKKAEAVKVALVEPKVTTCGMPNSCA